MAGGTKGFALAWVDLREPLGGIAAVGEKMRGWRAGDGGRGVRNAVSRDGAGGWVKGEKVEGWEEEWEGWRWCHGAMGFVAAPDTRCTE